MDADVYFAEQVIRDRIAEARAQAEVAALIRRPYRGSRRPSGIGHRLLELGRSLVKKGGRRAAGTRQPLEGGTPDDLHGETTAL